MSKVVVPGTPTFSIKGVTVKQLSLPAPKEFLWQYLHSTPLAADVAQVDDECRDSLERDVVAKWQEFVEDRALMLEVRIVVATARK